MTEEKNAVRTVRKIGKPVDRVLRKPLNQVRPVHVPRHTSATKRQYPAPLPPPGPPRELDHLRLNPSSSRPCRCIVVHNVRLKLDLVSTGEISRATGVGYAVEGYVLPVLDPDAGVSRRRWTGSGIESPFMVAGIAASKSTWSCWKEWQITPHLVLHRAHHYVKMWLALLCQLHYSQTGLWV